MPLAHDRRGSGPPLVLIHGTGSRRQVWDPVVDLLATEREVVCLDLPGFSDSPPLPAGRAPTVQALAQAVAEALPGLGLERPHVAGNSLGGAVSIELARLGAVRSATALSPVGFWSPPEVALTSVSLALSRAAAVALRPVAPALTRSPALRSLLIAQMRARPRSVTPAAAAGDIAGIARAPGFWPTLRHMAGYRVAGGEGIDVPVTVAWGVRDRLVPVAGLARARELLPQARRVPLAGCGHVPMADDPRLVAAVLLEGSAG